MRYPILFSALAFVSTSAQAQDWTYSATLYGWLPGLTGTIDTNFGSIELEPGDGDGESLFSLQGGFLGSFTARRGDWSFTGDVLYANLGATVETPFGPLYGDAEVGQKLTAISAYGFYRAVNSSQIELDVGAGLRNFELSLGVDIDAGVLPAVSQEIGANWTDPVIAARTTIPLGDRWFIHGIADWGGKADGDRTWQAYAGLGFNFNDAWSTQVGYRHMELVKDVEGLDVDLSLDGGIAAFTYRF